MSSAAQGAVRFFDDQLTDVLESSITGTPTLDVRALLTPIGFSNRLSSERAQIRCQRLVEEAMTVAGGVTGWEPIDDVTMPRSWVTPHQVLADLDAPTRRR